MDITKKNQSYFRSNLEELLFTNFPEKAYDLKFILNRSNWAFRAFEGALQGKNTEEEAEKIANSILFEGLYFSKFCTILEVVTFEFDTIFLDEEIRPFALSLLNHCDHIFNKFELTDDFAYSTTYDYLYKDLKEFILDRIERNFNIQLPLA